MLRKPQERNKGVGDKKLFLHKGLVVFQDTRRQGEAIILGEIY